MTARTGLVLVAGATVSAGVLVTVSARSAAQADAPTFTRDVAPIFYKHCTSCHREGRHGPMPLLTYDDARSWTRAIRNQVHERKMPPWHADPNHGRFANDRRMAQAEIDTIVAWVNGGAREGDPADLPPPPEYSSDWAIGEPDAVFSLPVEYEVPADGVVEYQHFDVQTGFTEEKWIEAVEVRPGAPDVVHHVIVYYREPSPPKRTPVLRFADGMELPPPPPGPDGQPQPRRMLGAALIAVAQGTDALVLRPDSAIRLGPGTALTFQMHYTPHGIAVKDRTSLGVRFAAGPPQREIRTAFLMNGSFRIPGGAANHEVAASATFLQDVALYSLLPHTHLRGKAWEYRLEYPDGRSEIILKVPEYDFNWQTDYFFANPLKVPAGTRLRATAWYDNSADNLDNPDPTVDVGWGDQTWEEMMFTSLRFSVEGAQSETSGQR